MVLEIIIFLVAFILLFSIKIFYEFDRGVLFTLGKYSGILNPGLRFVIPVIQSYVKLDIRTDVIDVPDQDAITKDNVSVRINAVLYYRVREPEKSVIEVED